MKKKNYGYIDILKFLFSICIIAIHTNILNNFKPSVEWYFTNGIFRLAVPFFFVTSGFFFSKKCFDKKNEIDLVTKMHIKRLFIPFFFWLIIGLLISEFKNTYTKNIYVTILLLIKKMFVYPWGALWYILALIISIFILSKFYKRERYIEPIIIGFLLYLWGLICNSYYFVISNNLFIKKIVHGYMNIFISARNGIFFGLLFVSIGGYLYKLYKESKLFDLKTNVLLLTGCYFAFLLEITIVKNNFYIDDHALYLMLPIISFLIVSIFIQLNTKHDYKFLRKYSICMYLVHRPILSILIIYFHVNYGFICFLLVFIISLLVSIVLTKIDNKYIKKITMT